jgi:hypothetical protein
VFKDVALPFTIDNTTTQYMSLNIVAPLGWLQVPAETCSTVLNQIFVQLVGNDLFVRYYCTEGVHY